MHVDKYGFIHRHGDEGLLLHYISQQLNQHYSIKLETYEKHQQHWSKVLEKSGNFLAKNVSMCLDLMWTLKCKFQYQDQSLIWLHISIGIKKLFYTAKCTNQHATSY